MGNDETPEYRPTKDAHKALGMWSIRRALTFAFSASTILLVGAWFLVSWLLGSPRHAPPKPLDTTAQLELLKLVFALVAGVGALVALVTAYRRQRVDEAAGERAERTQAHAERVALQAAYDATERRVTDLYGQAVEQLGHDAAAVRLGGLYSLERLAQDHPQHRQTATDVVCAYLRMPYEVPQQATRPEQGAADPIPQQNDTAIGSRQELQVRLTAQRLLHRHLTIPPDQETPTTYWADIKIDLTGARLIDFDFTHCRPGQATFTSARFSGEAVFKGATFGEDAVFEGATFGEDAVFDRATFGGDAVFRGASFRGCGSFDGATFGGPALFGGASFRGYARFGGVTFSGYSLFVGATFSTYALFGRTAFGGDAGFGEATFGKNALFDEAAFRGEAGFGEVTFDGDASFDRATFGGYAAFSAASFRGHARFDGATFAGSAGFGGTAFGGDAGFGEVTFGKNALFGEATFGGDVLFRGTRFDQEPDFANATAGHSNDNHVWPTRWRTQEISPDRAQLVRRD